jgi:hypothetical protein
MSRVRKAKHLLPALVMLATLGAFCPKEPRRAAAPQAQPEPRLAPLSAQLSEPGGYFDSDNLISNETSYLQVAEQLQDQVAPGGVYVGVGPDQNFNYIARVKPRHAFILDIRRQNMLQHLYYAALFAQADDPYQFLCLLFGRTCPAATPQAAQPGIERALQAALQSAPSEETFAAKLQAAFQHIEGPLQFPLQTQDRSDIRAIARAFFEEQAEIRFRSFRRPWAVYHPTYRQLLTTRSPSGRFGSFLDSPEDYRVVRDLSRGQRIVPVVGDFAGPQALRAIGRWVREQGLTVSVFYTSNVEFYLLRQDGYERFLANVRELPTRADSVLIRACFDYGRSHPAEMPGHRSATLLQRLPRFLELYQAGSYTSYWDVCTLDYLR